MIAKKSNSPTYDAYYDLPNAPVYQNVIDNVKLEGDDPGEYVLERKKSKESIASEAKVAENVRKPCHAKTIPGVYDYLDYEISPRTQHDCDQDIRLNDKEEVSKRKKIIFASFIGVCLIVAFALGLFSILQGIY